MKILSICIPTYNRKRLLERLINNIIEETRGIQDNIEICISDNGSNDGTEDMVKKYLKKYDFILYQKNNKNLGYDKNFFLTLEMSNGEYCWFIGDDDLFIKDSIQDIFHLITKKQYDYLMPEYKTLYQDKIINWEGKTLIEESEEIKQFLIDKLYSIGFIGSNIIKKEIYNKIKKELPKNFDSYAHVTLLFYSLKYIKSFFIIKDTKVISSQQGAIPTKHMSLMMYLKLSHTFKRLYKNKIILKKDYNSAINIIYNKFYIDLIFYYAIIDEDGATKEELNKELNEIKLFLKNTKNDNFLLKFSLFVIRIKFIMKILSICYDNIYIKMFNIFRKNKSFSHKSVAEENKKNGGRVQF